MFTDYQSMIHNTVKDLCHAYKQASLAAMATSCVIPTVDCKDTSLHILGKTSAVALLTGWTEQAKLRTSWCAPAGAFADSIN